MATWSIVQQSWQPSVVNPGDRIVGLCVTSNRRYTGTVAEVVGPICTPDCGGYRYRLTDTGDTYVGGEPVEPTVYAESWAPAPVDLDTITAGTRIQAVPAGCQADGSAITRTLQFTVDRAPWYGRDPRTVVVADRQGVTAVVASSIRVVS